MSVAALGGLPRPVGSVRLAVSRSQFLAGLSILLTANSLAAMAVVAVRAQGWFGALFGTFNISAIVLAACFTAAALLLKDDDEDRITGIDVFAGIAAVIIALAPFSMLSAIGLTALAIYFIATSAGGSVRRRSAVILLAVTGPVLWGPFLLDTFSQPFLRADAVLVSGLIGTERFGNVVYFADGIHRFQIFPLCSSFHGISLAILAWVTSIQLAGRAWQPKDLMWGGLAVVAVVAVNATRLSLIGLFREHFDLLHGPVGNAVASWLSLGLIVMICWLGVRREVFARL